MIKNKRLWSLFAFTFLASCTVGPDYKQPRLYENEQIAASLELSGGVRPVNKDWYRRFHDPLLDRLVAQSLKSSPDVKVGIQKLRQARDSLKIAAVGNLPMINADGSYHYNKPSKNIGYTIDTDYYQTGLDASWELDIWGSGRRQTESAAALFQAAAAGLDNVYLSITAEVAADYIGLRTSQAALDIAESNLKLQSDIFDLIKVKYDNGLVDTIAYNQAKYAVETTKALIPDLQSSIEAYKNALAVLTGKLPGALKPGGRVAIVTFHSGEDKLVKKALKAGYKDGIYSDYAKDVIRPSAKECTQNPRARSTKMRWAIKAE